MKKLLVTTIFIGMLAWVTVASAISVDQTGNLLNNGSFELGSLDPITGHSIQSAADNWRQWSNSGGDLTTELITNDEMQGDFGVGVIDDDRAFRISTSGGWDGAFTFESYHVPGWNPLAQLTFSAWVYTISGTMALYNGSNQSGFSPAISTTIGSWEFLSVTVDEGLSLLNNEPLLYAVGGAADFIVDGAWLNYGSAVENPSAPVPEPSTILLMGAGLLGLVGYRRKKLSKKS